MIKNLLAILIAAFMLSGCPWFTKPDATVPEKVVKLDPRVLEACKPLIGIPDNASFEDLMGASYTNFQLYYDCKAKQDASIVLLKQFSNYKEPK